MGSVIMTAKPIVQPSYDVVPTRTEDDSKRGMIQHTVTKITCFVPV